MGEYTILEYGFGEIPLADDAAEDAVPVNVALVLFEYTNTTDIPVAPQEAFGTDLAVREITETSETTLGNYTMDLPEDFSYATELAEAKEQVAPGETVTAIVAYGPIDGTLEVRLQSRVNPMSDNTDELDEELRMQ